MADRLFSGLLVRFPEVVITYSEARSAAGSCTSLSVALIAVGAQPRLERLRIPGIPEPPSTYYWGRIYGCFFDDAAGLASIDAIGPDHDAVETDYPTPTARGRYQGSRREAFTGLDQELVNKICRDNAPRLFGTVAQPSRHGDRAPRGRQSHARADCLRPVWNATRDRTHPTNPLAHLRHRASPSRGRRDPRLIDDPLIRRRRRTRSSDARTLDAGATTFFARTRC